MTKHDDRRRAGDEYDEFCSMSRMMWADRVPRVVDPAPHVRRRQLMRDVLDDLGRALMIGLTLGVAVGVAAALLATAIAKAMGWW